MVQVLDELVDKAQSAKRKGAKGKAAKAKGKKGKAKASKSDAAAAVDVADIAMHGVGGGGGDEGSHVAACLAEAVAKRTELKESEAAAKAAADAEASSGWLGWVRRGGEKRSPDQLLAEPSHVAGLSEEQYNTYLLLRGTALRDAGDLEKASCCFEEIIGTWASRHRDDTVHCSGEWV